MFLSGLKVFIPLIKPIVPMEIKSSTPTPVLSNFFAMYTTSLRLCSISIDLASSSLFSIKFFMHSPSMSVLSGAGRISLPPM